MNISVDQEAMKSLGLLLAAFYQSSDDLDFGEVLGKKSFSILHDRLADLEKLT